MLQSLQSTFLILSCPLLLLPLLPSLTSFSHPTSLLLSMLWDDLWVSRLFPPCLLSPPLMRACSTLTPLTPLPLHVSSPVSCHVFRSCLVEGGENRINHCISWPKGLDIIYLYLHCLLLGGEGGSRGWRVRTGLTGLGSEMSLSEASYIDTSYSRVSWWPWKRRWTSQTQC